MVQKLLEEQLKITKDFLSRKQHNVVTPLICPKCFSFKLNQFDIYLQRT